ncbi:MAG: orotidine 5'-phosphate decarboxylase / HUMPS family protein, partial [Candidatus Nealsonbacteria bacterium]
MLTNAFKRLISCLEIKFFEKGENMRVLKNPIIVALDGMTKEETIACMHELGKSVWGYKLSGLIIKEGMNAIHEIKTNVGLVNLFIDLQLVGIPRFMREITSMLSCPEVRFISCNAASGPEGIRASVEKAYTSRVLVGSILSSLGIADVKFIFDTPYREIKTYEFTRMAMECGAGGIYCSAEELQFLSHYPETKKIEKIVVGIRPEWYPDLGDHKVVVTPKVAMGLGANFLVIGSPITKAQNKKEAAEKILSEIQ